MADFEQDDDFDGHTRIANRNVLADPKSTTQHAYLIVLAGNKVGEMVKVTGDIVIGRGADVDLKVEDDGVSRKHTRVRVSGDKVLVEDMQSRNGTFVNGDRVQAYALKDGDKIEIGSTTILKFTFHDKLDEEFQKNMYEAALRDGLTHAYNHRYFDDQLKTEVAYAQRHGTYLSLMMLDIDHFKKINDTHGHLAGDAVLVQFAQTIQKAIRKEDLFARYGGEEFALLCRSTEPSTAKTFAERLRRLIETMVVRHNGIDIRVTASIGVASAPDPRVRTPESLVALADGALYEAKHSGRNRVVSIEPRPSSAP
jgi:two-component system cell cycle response regulator